MDNEKQLVDSTSSKSLETASKSDASTIEIDPIAERRLVRKLDFYLLPLFTLIYCCNFIDRTAIGNAKIAGLEKDLGMKGYDFNIALTIFYIFFLVSEVPSNLILKRVGSVWLAFLIVAFGVVTIGSAFVKTYGDLIITRVFLGIAEGGTLSGLIYAMSRFYRRHELVLRIGTFFGLAPTLAGAFGGLLASGILTLPNIGTVHGWRKIFLIEGIITTGIGIILLFFMPDDPRTTRMFNDQERALAIARLNADAVIRNDGIKEKTTLKLVLRSFNFNTTLCAIGFSLLNVSFQGLSIFLPTVINTLGHYTVVEAQLRTVPPYVVAGAVAVANAYFSYKLKQRAIPLLTTTSFMVMGYAIAIGTKNPHARYAACFLSISGGAPSGPIVITWGTDNAAPDTMRAVTTAAIPGIGFFGAIIGVWAYLPNDAPNYHKGNSINMGTSSLCFVLFIIGALYIIWENRKRDRGERDHRLLNKTPEEIEQLGYLHPKFRYQL